MTASDSDPIERVKELCSLAMSDPQQVDVDELADILSTPTVSPKAHGAAIVALSNVARVRDDVGETFVGDVHRLLGRPTLDEALVLRCLRQLATNAPEPVLPVREAITDRIELDESDVTQAATGCCVELVGESPTAFVDEAPLLSALLDVENETTRKNAVYVLSKIADVYPEEVKPLVPQLLTGITDRDETYQTNALSTLGKIASAYPTAVKPATDELAELTSAAAPKIRANAAGILADIAEVHPEVVAEHVPVLVDCLQSDDEYLRGNAATAVLHVGVENPDAAEQAIPALVELLDDPSPIVRRTACKALGQLKATVALVQLESVAQSDEDEAVRELASWAVDELS